MTKRSVSEDDLRRLKEQREAADKRYNDALTELDAAIQSVPAFPHPPPAPDETQVTALNTTWDVVAGRPPLPSGWRGRLARLVWRIVEPALLRQQVFNAALVDHVNRNVTPQREVVKSIESTITILREQVERLVHFQSRAIQFLQQITPYVDTKDYEFRGLNQRIVEDVAEAHAETARVLRGLAATVGAVSDDMLKRWERYEGLRTSVATLRQSVHALERELERQTQLIAAVSSARAAAASASSAAESAPSASSAASSASSAASSAEESAATASYALSSSRTHSHKYLGFEDAFRGDPETIRERQREYLPLFRGRADVLDVGCGRGEFLQLLKDNGITARGVDINHAMVIHCQEQGLDVQEVGAVEYLRTLPGDALGGLIAAQVVEHLQPDYLLAFLQEAFRVLRPGSPIVLETINVSSWSAFFSSYLRDLTHTRPIHPDTLRFFVLAAGFLDADIRYSVPLPEEERMQSAPPAVREVDLRATGAEGRALLQLADAFDANARLLNRQLYGPQDYAVIAWKR